MWKSRFSEGAVVNLGTVEPGFIREFTVYWLIVFFQTLQKLLQKQKQPMLVMFYAPCKFTKIFLLMFTHN